MNHQKRGKSKKKNALLYMYATPNRSKSSQSKKQGLFFYSFEDRFIFQTTQCSFDPTVNFDIDNIKKI